MKRKRVLLSTPGRHRVKAKVDRLTLDHWMQERKWGQKELAEALGREMKGTDEAKRRDGDEYSVPAISRRMSGDIRFTAMEAEAMARIFDQPLTRVMEVTGAAEATPHAGTIDETGAITMEPNVCGVRLNFTFRTSDAWNGATATAEVAREIGYGIYALRTKAGPCLRQCFGKVGGKAILSTLVGEPKIEHVEGITWQAKVTSITFR